MFYLYSAEKDVQVDESTEKVRDAVQTAEDAILEKNKVRSMGICQSRAIHVFYSGRAFYVYAVWVCINVFFFHEITHDHRSKKFNDPLGHVADLNTNVVVVIVLNNGYQSGTKITTKILNITLCDIVWSLGK